VLVGVRSRVDGASCFDRVRPTWPFTPGIRIDVGPTRNGMKGRGQVLLLSTERPFPRGQIRPATAAHLSVPGRAVDRAHPSCAYAVTSPPSRRLPPMPGDKVQPCINRRGAERPFGHGERGKHRGRGHVPELGWTDWLRSGVGRLERQAWLAWLHGGRRLGLVGAWLVEHEVSLHEFGNSWSAQAYFGRSEGESGDCRRACQSQPRRGQPVVGA
jgi:hypothetical protein